MSTNYIIESDVIDIRADQPKPEDIFLVDTNVWYWLTYSRASIAPSPPLNHQTTHYPSYIAKAIGAGSKLLWSGLSLSELAHIIEKTEREIFSRTIKPKVYRHNHINERANVISEIESVWGQVKSMALPLENLAIDNYSTDEALKRLSLSKLDGYDAFIINSLLSQDMVKVITDDGDYTSVPGLQVYTANDNVIRSSTAQGKVLAR
ncbi:PIN domain-containing protein [Paenibacillus algicola]|uniref:PIN domain-containing protein n=1 Tax=Paenibacillus algicola TaxID=2565926 RepID=UPI0010FE5788|nr:PIN domain-containing protein [Paenibacillus algicola]